MSDDEVDELLKAVDTSSGEINYTGMLYKIPHKPFFGGGLLTSVSQTSSAQSSPTRPPLSTLHVSSILHPRRLLVMVPTGGASGTGQDMYILAR